LAEQLYPAQPEEDPSYLYAEFTPASLRLEQGLAHIALGERYPVHRHPQQASQIFAQMEHSGSATVPDRIRLEITNHRATAAVLLNELDAFETSVRLGIAGVARLGSKQRQHEMRIACQRAIERWPHERRIHALTEEVRLATRGSDDEQRGAV